MGKANQARRKAKAKQRRQAASSATPPPAAEPRRPGPNPSGSAFFNPSFWDQPDVPPPPAPEVIATQLIYAAMVAKFERKPAAYAEAIRELIAGPAHPNWSALVQQLLTTEMLETLAQLWTHGWQPADVLRAARREAEITHPILLTDLIAAELQRYSPATIDPTWASQLAEYNIHVWWPKNETFLMARAEKIGSWPVTMDNAFEVLVWLKDLMPLQKLGPTPGKARPNQARSKKVDDRLLSRVRALLAKAESTNFPAEAETFTAGAQALMARHNIDRALLDAEASTVSSEVMARRIGIDSPYDGAKVLLLDAVARANRGRSVWTKHLGFCTVAAFPEDLQTIETLFTSLLVQATTALSKEGTRTGADGRSRTRTFRQSFLAGYAQRIGERLAESTREAAQAAAAAAGAGVLVRVLDAREKDVTNHLRELFPEMTSKALPGGYDQEGAFRGRELADRAQVAGPSRIAR